MAIASMTMPVLTTAQPTYEATSEQLVSVIFTRVAMHRRNTTSAVPRNMEWVPINAHAQKPKL
jgi:hypothetical protein